MMLDGSCHQFNIPFLGKGQCGTYLEKNVWNEEYDQCDGVPISHLQFQVRGHAGNACIRYLAG